VLRAQLDGGQLPWRHAAVAGWILDPDRKKMSKSIGNVVTPMDLLEQYGSDAVRYWAACGRPGVDTAFDTGQMRIGRRLATKILNASRFVLGLAATVPLDPAAVTEPVDLALLAELADVVDEATAAFEEYDYARALERTEQFFWMFCDDYLELVKARAYGEGADTAVASARTALALALNTVLRLFAPVLPFVTEEVWAGWRTGSVHRAPWPTRAELIAETAGIAGSPAATGDRAQLRIAAEVLRTVRKAKSTAKVSMRAEVSRLVVRANAGDARLFGLVRADLVAAGNVRSVEIEPAGDERSELVVHAML
jgi:valyl-tRNA synthetase